jgi:hypothetical protein
MPEPMSLIPDPAFRRVIQRFQYEAPAIINMTIRKNIIQMQDAAVHEAQSQLRTLVYNAELPESVYSDWWTPETYMRERRLGVVWHAVVKDPPVGSGKVIYGDVKVDRSDFEQFYYAWVLNEGSQTINYTARPFWTVMKRRMRTMLRTFGTRVLVDTKEALMVEKAKP